MDRSAVRTTQLCVAVRHEHCHHSLECQEWSRLPHDAEVRGGCMPVSVAVSDGGVNGRLANVASSCGLNLLTRGVSYRNVGGDGALPSSTILPPSLLRHADARAVLDQGEAHIPQFSTSTRETCCPKRSPGPFDGSVEADASRQSRACGHTASSSCLPQSRALPMSNRARRRARGTWLHKHASHVECDRMSGNSGPGAVEARPCNIR